MTLSRSAAPRSIDCARARGGERCQARRAPGRIRYAGAVRRALRAVALALVGFAAWAAAPASAEPTGLVTAPAGWRADPEQASALAQRFAATSHFGGLPAVTAVEVYVAERPGAALFATRATAELPADAAQAASAVRAALEGLRASSRRAALSGGSAEEQSWQERVETSPRQVAATLAWRDPSSHAAETARIVVASDGKRVVAVTGECISSDGAETAAVAACRRALGSLAPGIAAAQRVELAVAPEGAQEPIASAARAPATKPPPQPTARPAPTMSSGPGAPVWTDERAHLPPMAIAQDTSGKDRRTAYLGAGLVVLAAMFWWNRRRRDRFEREDRGVPHRAVARDDDADDLHAAARSDASDGPERQGRADGRHRRGPP